MRTPAPARRSRNSTSGPRTPTRPKVASTTCSPRCQPISRCWKAGPLAALRSRVPCLRPAERRVQEAAVRAKCCFSRLGFHSSTLFAPDRSRLTRPQNLVNFMLPHLNVHHKGHFPRLNSKQLRFLIMLQHLLSEDNLCNPVSK